MTDWRLHDLRRTVVTGMNDDLGIWPHVVEAVVNHVTGAAKRGVAGVYNRAGVPQGTSARTRAVGASPPETGRCSSPGGLIRCPAQNRAPG